MYIYIYMYQFMYSCIHAYNAGIGNQVVVGIYWLATVAVQVNPNPRPLTLNPAPCTLHPEPCTLNSLP